MCTCVGDKYGQRKKNSKRELLRKGERIEKKDINPSHTQEAQAPFLYSN
jgi:hypothetical protein